MGRRKVMFPRKQAWSTLWKSARFDRPPALTRFPLAWVERFGVQPLRDAAVQGTRDPIPPQARHTPCPFNGDGSFIDPVPARAMHPAPAQSPALQEPSASAGQVIA
jgi:hypothetical protein